MKQEHTSPVLTDSPPLAKSRLGIPSPLLLCSPPAPSYTSCSLSGRLLTSPQKKSMLSTLEDVRENGWLDAMKASSPPRKGAVRDGNSIFAMHENAEAAYNSWKLKYPSALSSFEQLVTFAKGKSFVLFLDYDGTLSPIVDDPDAAFMSDAMRATVRELVKLFPTAIISGRSRHKVNEFVALSELYYAGSHGMDIMGPVRSSEPSNYSESCVRSTDKEGKEVSLFQPAREFIPMIEEVFKSLVECTKEINGVKVENNKFCVSVHYRCVDEDSWDIIANHVFNILEGYPKLRVCHGRKVLEIRPIIKWDKGKAVEFLLESLGLNDGLDVFPIYIGDDRTDEDAFKALREKGQGCGILVSAYPRPSSAFYSLKDPSEVMAFLQSLVKWKMSGEL
ncbi:hypothetical protein AMTRI_Chr13g122370 [Amborella trichopoda]